MNLLPHIARSQPIIFGSRPPNQSQNPRMVAAENATKQSFADKLTYLLRQRSERIDELTSKLAQVREQNRRLDEENEHLADLIKFEPQLDAAMLAPK